MRPVYKPFLLSLPGLARQIEVTDRAIDALVYELYGLNDEEIRIV